MSHATRFSPAPSFQKEEVLVDEEAEKKDLL